MTRSKTDKSGADKVQEQSQSYEGEDSPFIEERYEIINNVRFDLKPAPSVTHQHLVGQLQHLMKTTCRDNGVILVSPLDVFLDDANHFQPDLVFILHENQHIIKETHIEGVPDLVVEVLSPSTSKNDKIAKKDQYERFGVQEYWIVDPVHSVLDQFVLENGRYQLSATHAAEGRLTSPLFACIDIDLEDLFTPVVKSNGK